MIYVKKIFLDIVILYKKWTKMQLKKFDMFFKTFVRNFQLILDDSLKNALPWITMVLSSSIIFYAQSELEA